MTHNDIFDSLTRNAFDFLKRGIAEFDQTPKYSVIHFCTAVEMLLKARLMKEHWSLIVSKPDQASLAKFKAGDFTSVTLEEARVRLRNIVGEDIGDGAYASFRALANHRNKMVHFFHQGLDSDEKAKAQIVAEHSRSWLHLHRLLKNWSAYFRDFHNDIVLANYAMKEHRKYLSTKFKTLKSELDAARTAGSVPRECIACGFKAAIPNALDDHITSLCCLVCDHVETLVALKCPHCSESIVIANECDPRCKHCKQSIKHEDLANVLTDQDATHIGIKDDNDLWYPVNCGCCEGYHTVVRRSDYYFCLNCFSISYHIDQCRWCKEFNTGSMSMSYLAGCGYCSGKEEWLEDN